MEKEKYIKNRRSSLIYYGISFLLILGIGGILGTYYGNQKQKLIENADTVAIETTDNVVSELSSTIALGESSIKTMAASVSGQMTGPELEDPESVIDPLTEGSPFAAVEYIRSDGMAVMSVAGNFDAGDREYYIQGMQGNSGFWVNYHPVSTEDTLLDFYAPLMYDGEPVGVLVGYIRASVEVRPLLNVSLYGQEVECLLFDQNGMVACSSMRSEFIKDYTVTQYLQNAGFTGERVDEIKTLLSGETDGVVSFADLSGQGRMCVKAIPDTDLYVAVIIPASSVNAMVGDFMRPANRAFLVLFLVLIVYLVFLLFSVRKEGMRILEEKDRVEADNERISSMNAELEKQKEALENAQKDREELETIRDLNSQLEESTAEQEAQLEEIAALNAQLEDNQAELEASLAERSQQIEEINELNRYLGEYSDSMGRAGYGMWHIFLKDGAKSRMQVNEKMAELLGIFGKHLSEEEIYDAWYDNILPEAVPSVQASVSEMLAGHFSENTYQWKHPTKGVIYVRCGGTAQKLEDGTDYLSGYHADVTDIVAEEQRYNKELKEAREKAEEDERKVSEAYGMIEGFSSEYHTIWVVDKVSSRTQLIRSTGKTTIQNAVQMGKDLPEFDDGFNQYIETYVEPEDRERMHKEIAFAEILRHLEEKPGEIYAVNYLRRDDSGHVAYHQIAFANADTKDGKKQFVYGFRDVDQLVKEEQAQKEELRKARDAAEASNKAKSAFLFNMSHDIRTPMNAIIGYANLMKRNPDSMDKWPDYLDKILQSSDFLLGLINNVLEMARIESGKMALDEDINSVDAFLDQVYSVFVDEMGKKDLTFTKSLSITHPYIYCDNVKLKEILLNILSNAQKYTLPGGAVNITITEQPSEMEGYVILETVISDTGIGMSEEYLPHIFEEFTREKNSSGNQIQGTGLGMPIVKKLVDLMGGTIRVSSKVGEGSSFTLRIPHRIAEKPAAVKKAEDTDVLDFTGKRILLAEDNDLNAEIAMEILSEYGFIVDRAEDGVICVDKLNKAEAGTYDLILMDIQMPNMNGYVATKTIRQMEDLEKADIPIIAMTANAFDEDKKAALDAGMDGHIAKPISIPVLVETLADLFQNRSSLKNVMADHKTGEDAVTHVKKIYFEMQQSKAVSVLPGGFFAYMAEAPEKLIYANDLCCSIWGCKDFEEFNELVGGSFKGIVHPDDYERAEKEIWQQIRDGETGLDQVKYRIIKKDGSVSHVDDYGRLIRDREVGDIFYVFVAETL